MGCLCAGRVLGSSREAREAEGVEEGGRQVAQVHRVRTLAVPGRNTEGEGGGPQASVGVWDTGHSLLWASLSNSFFPGNRAIMWGTVKRIGQQASDLCGVGTALVPSLFTQQYFLNQKSACGEPQL